jgi:ribonuclease HI
MFERVSWEHVRREYNQHADALANRAMDAQAAARRG